MNKEFVPYRLRTKVIDLGYDVLKKSYGAICYHREDMKGKPIISTETAVRLHGSTDCLNHPAISYQQAFRWFREKHGLWNMIYPRYGWNYSIQKMDETISCTEETWHKVEMKSYEEAELACLRQLIKIVKTK